MLGDAGKAQEIFQAIMHEAALRAAEGELPNDQGFAGTKIDLGGFNYLVSFKVRF